jgi:hypothetical protein
MRHDLLEETWERSLLRVLVTKSLFRHYSFTLFYLLLISSQFVTGIALDLQHTSKPGNLRQTRSQEYQSDDASYCERCYKNLYKNAHTLGDGDEHRRIEICVTFYNAIQCINKDKTLVECFENNPINKMQMRSYFELKFQDRNCDQIIPLDMPDHWNGIQFNNTDTFMDNQCDLASQDAISLQSPPRFCSLFGDPHLVTYSGQTQTCAAIGAWPLVDNFYFTVQALNVALDGSSDLPTEKDAIRQAGTKTVPSAITRIMIIFRAKMNSG